MKVRGWLSIVFLFVLFFSFSPYASADGTYPVRIASENMIVFPSDANTVDIVQIMNFKNSGTEKEKELPIYLPEGYSNFELRGGLTEENMKKTEKGIVDTSGLEAGEEKQIIVYYQMPMQEGSSQWEIIQPYVTENLQVIIQPGILTFQANDLVTQSQLFEMNGQEYRRFTRLDLHPDIPWLLSFRLIADSGGEEAQETPPGVSDENSTTSHSEAKFTEDGIPIIGAKHKGVFLKIVFTFGTIAIALSAALIGLKRDRQSTIAKPKRRVKRPWLINEKAALLEELAALERDFQAELISSSTYESTRDKFRSKLIQITTELQRG